MEIVEMLRLVVVPRAGVEPARPYGQRILSLCGLLLLMLQCVVL